MATRLIGTDSADPWLPDIVKVHANKTRITDTAGNFTATDVEAALAELAAGGFGSGGGIASTAGSPGLPVISTITTIRMADFLDLTPPDPNTFYVIVPDA